MTHQEASQELSPSTLTAPAPLEGEWERPGDEAAPTPIDLAERIREAHQRITNWEAQREDLADRIRGETDMLREYGITPAAFKAARKYLAASEAKRAGMDASYIACRYALGVPVQQTLPL